MSETEQPETNRTNAGPDETLATLERNHILEVLRRSKHNKTQAAKRLGLDRRTLYRKLQSYEVSK